NRNPDGAHVRHFHLFADEPLHDVQIVNHQIEDDIYIERASGEFADAVNLEIEGSANVRTQRDERGVEAFEMADLKQRAAFVSRRNHAISFFECARDGLFDEDVDACFQKLAGNLGVRFSRDGEADGLTASDNVPPISRPFRISFDGDVVRGLFVQITNGNEFNQSLIIKRGVDARMLTTQMSNADHD